MPDHFPAAARAVEWRLAPNEEAALRLEPAIALALLVGACDRGPPPPPMHPVGAPGFVATTGEQRPRFDAHRPPVVRVDGITGPGWTLWLAPDGGDAVALETRVEATDGGAFLRSTLPEPPPTGPVTLVVHDGKRRIGQWPVWLGKAPVPDRYRDRPRDLETLDAHPPQSAAERRWWSFARGMALWRAGHLDAAITAMEVAAEAGLDPAVDQPGEAGRALRMAAMLANRRGRLADTARFLDRAEAVADRLGDRAGRSTVHYWRANAALARGALHDAEAHIEAAMGDARAAGRLDLTDYAAVLGAVIRQKLGHHAAARTQLEALAKRVDGMRPDLAGAVWINLGWVLLEGIERGAFAAEHTADVRRAFERALAINGERAAIAANLHANLAGLALRTGDLAGVKRAVAAYDALDPDRRQQSGLFVDLIDARRLAALGEHDRAEAAFTAVEARARAEAGDVTGDWVWRARLGRARTHRARGEHDRALAAFGAALDARERAATRTALQGSRAVFLDDHRALYDEAITAAIGAGRVDDAFTVADRARARLVVDLEVRARIGRLDPTQQRQWQAKLEAYLTRRQAFEAARDDASMLTPAELPAWRARRATERRALQAAFDAAYAWLDAAAPITARGATAADVRAALGADEALWSTHVMASGATVRFRVRPDGVAVLDAPQLHPDVAHRYVVGPLDPTVDWWGHGTVSRLAHARQRVETRPTATGRSTVIGDPDGTLPHARREAEAVAARWTDARRLLGHDARRDAVRAALVDARRVHYAGHGVLTGLRPWDAHLKLAGGERLTLEDILLARPAAELVVLSGCETGAEGALSGSIALGLAQGFLAAGSRSVVAADRTVPDADAARFVERFYAAEGSPTARVRAATQAARAEGSPVWDAWHVWGRR